MTKNDLLQDIRQSITDRYLDYLDTVIPAAPPEPENAEAAIKKVGQLASYLTTILSAFVGLAPLRIPYHMGQGNEAVLGLLLASLEVSEQTANKRIIMITPQDGGVYYGAVTEVTCKAEGATDVSVSTDGDTFSLSLTGENWSGLWAFPIGKHNITVIATYETGETAEETVNFEVVFWPIYPTDGESVSLPVEIRIETQGTEISGSVTVRNDAGSETEILLELIDDTLVGVLDAITGGVSQVWTLSFKIAYEVQEYYREITLQNRDWSA